MYRGSSPCFLVGNHCVDPQSQSNRHPPTTKLTSASVPFSGEPSRPIQCREPLRSIQWGVPFSGEFHQWGVPFSAEFHSVGNSIEWGTMTFHSVGNHDVQFSGEKRSVPFSGEFLSVGNHNVAFSGEP